MSEKYIKWYPIKEVPFPLDLDELCRNRNGLYIILDSEDHPNKSLNIHFSECEALREIDDEFKSKFWHDVDIEEDFSLFIIENSEWLESFHAESENHYRELSLQHYAIWTTENWIDILSSSKPIVKWDKK